MSLPIIMIGIAAFLVIVLVLTFVNKYRTAGPDEALIVTGSGLGSGKNVVSSEDGKKIKIIRGGGTFVMPVFQQADALSLLNHKLEVGTKNTYTLKGVPVTVNGVAIIKVGSSIEEISTAAEQYLGKPPQELELEAKEVLEGHLRSILSTMDVEDIYKNREQFSQEVNKQASTDLAVMGLKIVSFTIREIFDENGYMDALGKPQIEAVKRDATIQTAMRQKESRIEAAKAEKEAREAEIQRDTLIAEAEKDKILKMQAYKKEQEQARAETDQAYNLQTAIANQKVKEEEMKIQIIERQKQIELEEKEIARREKQYDAEVKKKADADRYAMEQKAEADKNREMRQAEAEKYKIEAQAQANAEQVRAQGLAKAEIEKAQGLAQAEAEKAKGTAEADIIRAKGLAEAEAKQKIAEAFEKFGQAAVLDMVVKMLPEYAGRIAAPLGNIDKITVVDTGGDGKNSGAGRVTGYATGLMSSLQESLKETTGLDLVNLVETYAGKNTIRPSIDNLTSEIAKKNETAVTVEDKHTNLDSVID